MGANIRGHNPNAHVFHNLNLHVDIFEALIAIIDCCGVHAGLPGTNGGQTAEAVRRQAVRRFANMVAG
jgi:hypothetical protein